MSSSTTARPQLLSESSVLLRIATYIRLPSGKRNNLPKVTLTQTGRRGRQRWPSVIGRGGGSRRDGFWTSCAPLRDGIASTIGRVAAAGPDLRSFHSHGTNCAMGRL